MKKSFTIVTPVLNGMPLVRRCVGSVRGQSASVFEHVVQDGGSTDGTREWLVQQPDLKVVSGPDQGMYDAIAQGWRRGTGSILSWLNADEQYLPGTLMRVERAFRDHPDVDFVFGDAIITSPEGIPLAARREIPLRAAYVRHGFLYALSCTMFFRRRLWDEGLLRFDLRYKLAGDMDAVLRLLEGGAKALHLPHYLGVFTAGRENMSTQPAMESETYCIRRSHGAIPGRLVQRVMLMGRYLERSWCGCYRKDRLTFRYAVDDKPIYRDINSASVGWRFSYLRARCQIERMKHE